MITEIVYNSVGKPDVSMSEEGWEYTTKLRSWMFDNVYIESPAKLEESKARHVVKELYYLYMDMIKDICPPDKAQRVVVDYISGMTDRYAIERFKRNFIPEGFKNSTKGDFLYKLANMADKI